MRGPCISAKMLVLQREFLTFENNVTCAAPACILGPPEIHVQRQGHCAVVVANVICRYKQSIAYFLAKDIAVLPQCIVGPLLFTSVLHALTAPLASLGTFYLPILAVYYATAGAFLRATLHILSVIESRAAVAVIVFGFFARMTFMLMLLLENFKGLTLVTPWSL